MLVGFDYIRIAVNAMTYMIKYVLPRQYKFGLNPLLGLVPMALSRSQFPARMITIQTPRCMYVCIHVSIDLSTYVRSLHMCVCICINIRRLGFHLLNVLSL